MERREQKKSADLKCRSLWVFALHLESECILIIDLSELMTAAGTSLRSERCITKPVAFILSTTRSQLIESFS